ncbi:unnamed protein product [Pleuronectes platessa]|uniref:Uncharacterized protein n=1 Tax=Pleuronectes platessa TaxID=8262 RepID=A0A9N7YI82_PLEPL|nr:unnamed protein product [Pleuronectes platessa]
MKDRHKPGEDNVSHCPSDPLPLTSAVTSQEGLKILILSTDGRSLLLHNPSRPDSQSLTTQPDRAASVGGVSKNRCTPGAEVVPLGPRAQPGPWYPGEKSQEFIGLLNLIFDPKSTFHLSTGILGRGREPTSSEEKRRIGNGPLDSYSTPTSFKLEEEEEEEEEENTE